MWSAEHTDCQHTHRSTLTAKFEILKRSLLQKTSFTGSLFYMNEKSIKTQYLNASLDRTMNQSHNKHLHLRLILTVHHNMGLNWRLEINLNHGAKMQSSSEPASKSKPEGFWT